MRKRATLCTIVLLTAVVLAGCGGGDGPADGLGLIEWPEAAGVDTGPEIGQRAPNFRLESPAGQPIELASYAGRPVLINFFASWCANCREEMQALEAASREGVAVIGVDYRESAETVTRLVAETGVTFPVGLDRDTEVSRQGYRVTNLPVTVVIDREGIIREIVRGPVDEARIAELVAGLTGASGEGGT